MRLDKLLVLPFPHWLFLTLNLITTLRPWCVCTTASLRFLPVLASLTPETPHSHCLLVSSCPVHPRASGQKQPCWREVFIRPGAPQEAHGDQRCQNPSWLPKGLVNTFNTSEALYPTYWMKHQLPFSSTPLLWKSEYSFYLAGLAAKPQSTFHNIKLPLYHCLSFLIKC